jgi:hypothetical protein
MNKGEDFYLTFREPDDEDMVTLERWYGMTNRIQEFFRYQK